MIETINSVGLNLFYTTAFGIFKEDGGRSILKWTLQQMYFNAFFRLIRLFAIQIYTLIELFIRHPHAIECFLTDIFDNSWLNIHALAFYQLNLRTDSLDVFFGH
jgi:hypothetical protein